LVLWDLNYSFLSQYPRPVYNKNIYTFTSACALTRRGNWMD